MSKIVDPDDSFAFEKLVLTKPVSVAGGNYFIRFVHQGAPLYIQSPKCKTRQGIVKGGKKFYSDLIFTSENDAFIRWVENLELYCHQYIFKNREQWFDGDLEQHDIENYFTSPLKLYKAGKCYLLRANVASALGKITLNIYDEDENKIDPESIGENHELMTILEVQGIKCSARSFQIDIEIRQMMVLKTENLFEKCIIRKDSGDSFHRSGSGEAFHRSGSGEAFHRSGSPEPFHRSGSGEAFHRSGSGEAFHRSGSGEPLNKDVQPEEPILAKMSENIDPEKPDADLGNPASDAFIPVTEEEFPSIALAEAEAEAEDLDIEMKEINITLDEIPTDEGLQIKNRNDVYYEMYKEAKRKAKIARDLALSSYLEAKRIKNTYLLEDLDDSDSEFSENPSI